MTDTFDREGGKTIERVAFAIFTANCPEEAGKSIDEVLYEKRNLWCLAAARAAIFAIRQPSDSVLVAMRNTVPVDGHEWEYLPEEGPDHWRAMIDAILTEE